MVIAIWTLFWLLIIAFIVTTKLAQKDMMAWWIPDIIGLAAIGAITYIFFTILPQIERAKEAL